MSVTVEMWVRGHRERIDTALWQLEESLTGAVRTGDRWLGNPDDQGLVQGWFKVEITDVSEESAACKAIRRALASTDEGVVFGGPCLPELEVPERE